MISMNRKSLALMRSFLTNFDNVDLGPPRAITLIVKPSSCRKRGSTTARLHDQSYEVHGVRKYIALAREVEARMILRHPSPWDLSALHNCVSNLRNCTSGLGSQIDDAIAYRDSRDSKADRRGSHSEMKGFISHVSFLLLPRVSCLRYWLRWCFKVKIML